MFLRNKRFNLFKLTTRTISKLVEKLSNIIILKMLLLTSSKSPFKEILFKVECVTVILDYQAN